MQLSNLLSEWISGNVRDCTINNLQHDSRLIKPGDLFLAYPGALADGRLFINAAINAGAIAVAFDKAPSNFDVAQSSTIPLVAIPNLSRNLSLIASRFYNNPSQNMSIIGITGTNGKTTVAYLLAQAYDLLNQDAAYIGTLGAGRIDSLSKLGNTTPDALYLQRTLLDYHARDINTVCMEVSSHALSQERVGHINFKQAIFTNLSHDHLDYHHTMDEYARAKSLLFNIPTLESAIINSDDAYAALMIAKLPKNCALLTYGTSDSCDIRALNWTLNVTGSEILVQTPVGTFELRSSLVGLFNIYNILAVFASLLARGVEPNRIVNLITKLRASPGRMEVVASNPTVIVDYAHTPDALEKALTTLNELKTGKLILVFGCGGNRDKTKRPIMGRIASEHADIVIITNDNPRHEDPLVIIDEITAGIENTSTVTIIPDRADAIRRAISLANPNDLILIAGKGHEEYQEIGSERVHFSDQECAKNTIFV